MSTTVWIGLAAGLSALALLGLASTMVALFMVWRLHRDRQVVEAAERHELVNLTNVVKRYVPGDLQSNRPAEEIPLARDGIVARLPRWRRLTIACAVLTLCAGAVAPFLVHRSLQAVAAARNAPKPPPNLDVLKVIQGVWGWKFDTTQSCGENPQTMAVTDGGRQLAVRYTKPVWDGRKSVDRIVFQIEATRPDAIELLQSSGEPIGNRGQIRLTIRFLDADLFEVWGGTAGLAETLERCR